MTSKPEIPPSPFHAATEPGMEDKEELDEDALDDHRSIGELASAGALAGAAASDSDAIPLEDDSVDKDAPKAAKPPKNKKLKVPNFDRFRLFLIGGIGLAIALVVFLFFALTVLPKAKVTITTTSTPVTAAFNLTASDKTKQLDIEKKQITSTLKTLDQTSTQTVQASGQQNLGEKAEGSVTMTAQDCAPPFTTPDDVPSGSGMTSNGLSYITQSVAKFSLDSAAGSCVYYKSKSTDIVAIAGGAKYNTTLTNVNVRSGVTASGTASGGTDNIVTVISQQDADKAKEKITTQSSDEFSKKFQEDLDKSGFYVLASTLKIGEAQVSLNPAVGTQASSATASVKITYTVLVLPKEDLRKLVSAEAEKNVDKNRQKINGDILDKTTLTVTGQPTPSSAALNVDVDANAIPLIDEQNVKQISAGKKTSEIRNEINRWPGVKDVDVKMSPFWVSKAPKKITKISVDLKESGSNQ